MAVTLLMAVRFIFIDPHKGIHDDEIHVWLSRSSSFRHFCPLSCLLWEACETFMVPFHATSMTLLAHSSLSFLSLGSKPNSQCTLCDSIHMRFDEKGISLRLSLLVFILLFIDSHNLFLHFDVAQVKTRFMWEPLVTNVSLGKSHNGMCLSETPCPSSKRTSSSVSSLKVTMSFSTLTSPKSKQTSRGSRLSRMFLW